MCAEDRDPLEVTWVETHQHPSDKVTIIERWVPAPPGEYAPMLFGPWNNKRAMKLESRRVVDNDAGWQANG